jgi:signal transduction histidine kinase
MSEELYFSTDATLIDRIGRELVSKQETALVELVKNSYDADATEVTVAIDRDRLTISDNGTGMNREELIEGFLRLASDLKVRKPVSDLYRRRRAGRKGIGRFATQRLGTTLVLRTWKKPEATGLKLSVNWRDFKRGVSLDAIPVELEEIAPRQPGTEIEIGGLRDSWTESQVRRCWRGVIGLQQPFPVAPIATKPNADPGFSVQFTGRRGSFSDTEVIADLQTEVLNHLHALVEFRVDDHGVAEWRLSRNRFGPDRGWSRVHHEHVDEKSPPAYATLRNVGMKAYYFILDPSLLTSLVYTRLRDILRYQGGVRLYRNGFRVVPYGSPGDDWLKLDETYASRGQTLAPVRNLNFFGVVEIVDTQGKLFEESTSREGLIENPAFEDLKQLASTVILTAVRKIAEDRGRKPRAGSSRQPPGRSTAEILREAERLLASTKEHIDNVLGKKSEDDPSAANVAALLKEGADVLAAREAELADETVILRLLATLGITAAEFSHETGMTFDAVRISFRNVFEAARIAKPADVVFQQDIDLASSMLNRLDALTSYLNSVASARAVRSMSPVSVSREIQRFNQGLKQQAQKLEVDLVVETPPIDPLYTKPMHEAEIATILLNFYSNSIKAMRRNTAKRKIFLRADRGEEGEIRFQFSDTGDGIPFENREKVFDLFFTTRVAPPTSADHNQQISGTGLGLWIVRQIASKAGGEVEVIDPPVGYSTCVEVRLPAEEDEE